MAKQIKKQPKTSPRPTTTAPETSTRRKSLPTIKPAGLLLLLITVGIALIPFYMGKFIEFNTPNPFDSALNVYSAKSLLDGQKVGVDIYASARPNTMLVNIIGVAIFGYGEFGPIFMQMVLQAAALGFMFITIRKFFGLLPAAVALVLAAFYLSCPPFVKTGNAKEQLMIPFMTASVCSLIWSHHDRRSLWLYLCGAFAVNTWFFKPTGFSVTFAIGLFLLLQPILYKASWKTLGLQLKQLFLGAGLGLIPLAFYHHWQGMLNPFLSGFPVNIIIFALIIIGVIRLIPFIRSKFIPKKHTDLPETTKPESEHHPPPQPAFSWKKLPWKLIIPGLATGLVLMLAMFIWLNQKEKGQGVEYLKDVPAIHLVIVLQRYLFAFVRTFFGQIQSMFSMEYLLGAREVSDFKSQYDWIVGYYRWFVVPFGLCLFAIGHALVLRIKTLRKPRTDTSNDKPQKTHSTPVFTPERAILLLGLWWLLDTLFIWISPRSYVEYFLPQAASGALLAGFAVDRCRQIKWGPVWLLGLWLALALIFKWVGLTDAFPFVEIRSIRPEEAFWDHGGLVILGFVLLAATFGITLLQMKPRTRQSTWMPALLTLCVISALVWNKPNFQSFNNKIAEIKEDKQKNITPSWIQVAHFIRDRSEPDDQIYVWGWFPGIYVHAQRSSSASDPALSDMHIQRPAVLYRTINQLVSDLRVNPPRFIIDSQKIHFPYYDHPTFDLWPRWENGQVGKPYMRFHSRQPLQPNALITLEQWRQFQSRMYEWVEQMSMQLLTRENRTGGPLDEEEARRRARRERERHEVMEPLREFVMTHYQPVPLSRQTPMYIYVRNQ